MVVSGPAQVTGT